MIRGVVIGVGFVFSVIAQASLKTVISPFEEKLATFNFAPSSLEISIECQWPKAPVKTSDPLSLQLKTLSSDGPIQFYSVQNTQKLELDYSRWKGWRRTEADCGIRLRGKGRSIDPSRSFVFSFLLEGIGMNRDVSWRIREALRSQTLLVHSEWNENRKKVFSVDFISNEALRSQDLLPEGKKSRASYLDLELGTRSTFVRVTKKGGEPQKEEEFTVENLEKFQGWTKVSGLALFEWMPVWITQVSYGDQTRWVYWSGHQAISFLDFSVPLGSQWSLNRFQLGKGSLTLSEKTEVEVPAGKYADVFQVDTSFRAGTQYFARDVGLVKQVQHLAGDVTVITELKQVEKKEAAVEKEKVHYQGSKACIHCHKGNTQRAWENSAHAISRRWIFESWGDRQAQFAKALGMDRTQAQSEHSACLDCHGARFSPQKEGVSCDSCHGVAPASNHLPNWIPHHDVLPQHGEKQYEWEKALAETTGWIRPGNSYTIAKKCVSCHLVPNEALVNSGHKGSQDRFELVSYLGGEVRHNFYLDEKVNAEAPSIWKRQVGGIAAEKRRIFFLTGLLVELEWSLQNIGGAQKLRNSRFCAQNLERMIRIYGRLGKVVEKLGDQAPATLRRIRGMIQPYLKNRNCVWKKDAAELALRIGKIAQKFSTTYQGDGWEGLDEYLDSIVRPVGEAYVP